METSKPLLDYYNIAGRYVISEKEFKKYLKTELDFYKKLHEKAVEKGTGGIRLGQNKTNFFDLEGFNPSLNNMI